MSAPSSSSGRPRRIVWSTVLLAVGVALLVWTVRRLELTAADIQSGFSKIGIWFGVILLVSLARFFLRARAWTLLTGLPLPTGATLAAIISGDALGNVTPLGLIASEPAKALYLRPHAEPSHTLAALVAENFFYSVSVAIYVVIASAAMFALFDLNPAVGLAGQLSLGLMAVVLAGAAWLAWQRPAIVSRLLGRVPGRAARTLATRVARFEQQTYGAATARQSLGAVCAYETGFHLLSLAECWLTFWLLTGETSIAAALVFDGFNRVVNVVAKPIPMRVGVEEGGTALLAGAIGLLPHDGFMLGIVRKVRMIVWAAVGLALWTWRSGQTNAAVPSPPD
jgi:hypothetical protein